MCTVQRFFPSRDFVQDNLSCRMSIALAKKRTITDCLLTLSPIPQTFHFRFSFLPRSGYIVAGATSFLVGQLGLPFAEFITVAGAVIAQDMTETTHAPAIMAAVGAGRWCQRRRH